MDIEYSPGSVGPTTTHGFDVAAAAGHSVLVVAKPDYKSDAFA